MIIVKVGGGKEINWDYVCADFAALLNSEEAILVHGASAKRDELAEELGHPTRKVISPSGIASVYTDRLALEIFLMAYAGEANKRIVAMLQATGVNAIGLSGVDGRLWEGERKPDILISEGKKTKLLRNNYTGRVRQVNTKLIKLLLENRYVPIICSPAISFADEIINVDNDLAIAVMAGSLKVEKIVNLFEAPGLLEYVTDESTLIKRINRGELDRCIELAENTMQKKIIGAKEAFANGVRQIYWGDGRIKNPISNALAGKGTIIK